MTYIKSKPNDYSCSPDDKGVIDSLIRDINFIKNKLSNDNNCNSDNSTCSSCKKKEKEIELLTEKINSQTYINNQSGNNNESTTKIILFCFAALCLVAIISAIADD